MSERQVPFFGDSHVAGTGDPEGLGWVGRVAASSLSAGQPFTPYNLGVGGNTSVDVLRRWPSEAQWRERDLAETRLVFSFGVNDTTLEGDRRRVEPKASIEALGRALGQAGELGLATFVVGPTPVEGRQQTDRIAALSSAFALLCAKRGVPFVDVVGALRRSQLWLEEVAADGAHPGAEGYALLAELVMSSGWLDWRWTGRAGADAAAIRLAETERLSAAGGRGRPRARADEELDPLSLSNQTARAIRRRPQGLHLELAAGALELGHAPPERIAVVALGVIVTLRRYGREDR